DLLAPVVGHARHEHAPAGTTAVRSRRHRAASIVAVRALAALPVGTAHWCIAAIDRPAEHRLHALPVHAREPRLTVARRLAWAAGPAGLLHCKIGRLHREVGR